MATAQLFITCDNTSDANFRSWGSAISAQLDAMGWTKTSDTGQINWTTVTLPAAGVYGGFEIRQPASDPLQSGSTAYYLKVEYGSRTTGGIAQIRLSLGTGTNGAGTLTGFVTNAQILFPGSGGSNSGTVSFECDFSWDASRLSVLMWRNASNAVNAGMFFVERIKNADGTDSSDGVTLAIVGGSNSAGAGISSQQSLIFGKGPSNNLTQPNHLRAAAGGTTDAFANSIPLSPVFPDYGKFGYPHTGMVICWAGDVAEGEILTTTLYGATHTYLLTKSANFLTNVAQGIRYD